MSLLGPVVVVLTAAQSAALAHGAKDLETLAAHSGLVTDHLARIAGSLETVVAALGGSGLSPEQEAQVAALVAQLKASGDALGAAEAANP